MGHTKSQFERLRSTQNELLYGAVKFSAVGSIVAAFVLIATFKPIAQSNALWWAACVCLVYGIRWVDSILYFRDPERAENVRLWHIRFGVGSIAAALAWSSSLWLVFPGDHGYQALLLLSLVGVASGSLASLPYDKHLALLFQGIIFCAVEVRLLTSGDTFALEMAVFCAFIFSFLMSCGKEVSRNYQQLVQLRLDTEQHNLSLIRTTEQIARMGYWQWDLHSEELELSENLSLMCGFDKRRIPIDEWMSVVHADDVGRLKRVLAAGHGSENESAVEFRMAGAGVGMYRDMNQITKYMSDSDGTSFLLGTVQDISALKSAEQKIYKMAFFDELTGLSNRGHFHEQLKTQVALAQRASQKLAVVYVDLDDFKGVNDSYGHEVGDNYLRIFAEYIKSSVRATDITARLGGDEFCVVLYGVSDREEVSRITQLCLQFTEQTVEIGNHRIQPKLSVGISVYPDDATTVDGLIKNADMAMYSVKQNGKHGYRFFEPEMVSEAVDRVKLEASLRQAIDNNQFELWYQPKVALGDYKLSGVEALIRWRHPEKGIISPDVFISTAERVGMINEIGDWVLKTACLQLKQWHNAGFDLQMAINISGGHFIEDGFTEKVFESISVNQLNPSDIEIEITESMSRDPEQHSRICQKLRSAGVRIAIDDFGTGYSSLSVLDKLEVDTLKIDRSFIMGLPDDKSSILLVQAIMELSLGLGYDVVAEGVETEAQLEHLKALNCPYIQGYFFSKPVMAEEIPLLLNSDWEVDQAA